MGGEEFFEMYSTISLIPLFSSLAVKNARNILGAMLFEDRQGALAFGFMIDTWQGVTGRER